MTVRPGTGGAEAGALTVLAYSESPLSLPDCRSAGDLRRVATATHMRLSEMLRHVREGHLHDQLPGDQPTVAQQLGHLGQSMSFFAGQLGEWLEGRRQVVGRPRSGDADELDALEAATAMRLTPLMSMVEAGLAETRSVLDRITDRHGLAWIMEIDTGRRPLITYVRDSVLGHTDHHVRQLAEVLE